MPKPSYFEARLIVRPPFNEAAIVKLAIKSGFAGGKIDHDDDLAKSGDYVFTTTEDGRDRLEARVTALVNLFRTTGHGKNTGVCTIKPRT